MYGNKDNLLIYTYFTTEFLMELHALDFLNSEYYQTAKFQNKFLHENFSKWGGIENPGMFMMALYAMLVLPKQLIEDTLPAEFAKINPLIDEIKSNAFSSYKKDKEKIDYIRHIRNAVAHANADFSNGDSVIFKDKDPHTKSECEIEIPLADIGKLISGLQSLFLRYVDKVKTGFRA